jgi:hypothetical protein
MTKYISLLVLMLSIVFTSRDAAAERKKLVVVVVKGSPVTNISRADLKHAFLGDPVTAGGKTLVPFNSEAKTPERIGFDKAILGMNADEVGRFWVDRKVRGQSAAPRALPSIAHIQKVVAKFPGAIGYLPADQLTPDLQPVKLDGVAYTDGAYPIVSE